MRAAKMLCKNKKRPIAMKGGGSAAKKKKKIKVVIPKGTPKFNLARPSQETRVSSSKSMADAAGGAVKKMKRGGDTSDPAWLKAMKAEAERLGIPLRELLTRAT